MGLDMYLTKRTYVKNWNFQKDEEKHKVTVQDIGSNDIPDIIKRGMHVSSKIMKKLTSLI